MTHAAALIRRSALVATAAFTLFASASGALAEDMSARFSWKLKGEYGFFFLGQAKGLYKDAGLTVAFGEGAGAQAALGSVIQGQDDVAVVPGIFAITAIQKGMPVKIISLYQPAAPVVLISHPENPVLKPSDLEGKSIASAIGETSTEYLGAFCTRNNIDCKKINKIQMNSQTRIPQFVQKKVDTVGMYRTSDLPVIIDRTAIDFPILDMTKFGLQVPGLAVVASTDAIGKKADMLRRFLAATRKAIEMSRSDPDAATAALRAVWQGGPSEQVVRKQIEATSQSIPPSTGKPLGWVDDAEIAEALKLIGSVEDIGAPKPLSNFYTNELLTQ